MSQELELYKLLTNPDEEDEDVSYVSEFGWINDKKFIVWVDYLWIKEFIEKLEQIFGCGIFDEGGFDGNIQSYGIAFDLCEAVGCCMDIEEVFPKDKYKH